MSNYAEECMKNYPPDHKPAMVVPKGGSSCAKCVFLREDKKHCYNAYFIRWRTINEAKEPSLIPGPIDGYCSDWFRPRRHSENSTITIIKCQNCGKMLNKGDLVAPIDTGGGRAGRIYFCKKCAGGRFKLKIKNPKSFEVAVKGKDYKSSQWLKNEADREARNIGAISDHTAYCGDDITNFYWEFDNLEKAIKFETMVYTSGPRNAIVLSNLRKRKNPIYPRSDAPKVKPGDYIRVFEGATGRWLDGFAKSLPKHKKGIWLVKLRIDNEEKTAVWSGSDFILGRVE